MSIETTEKGYAAFMLGKMYEDGEEGVPPDYRQAVEFYRKAAEYGHAEALYNLGRMYDRGLGVWQNKSLADHGGHQRR